MVSSSDDRPLSGEEIRAAAANGHLPVIAERLARGRDFARLIALYEQLASVVVPAPLLTETVQRTSVALGRPGSTDATVHPQAQADDRRAVRLLAGEALLARTAQPALTEADRAALAAAATILADAGDLYRAARTFEAADQLPAAAELWGKLGDLDAMEACLARDEERRLSQRAGTAALRDVEERLAAGERLAALAILKRVPEGVGEARRMRQLALEIGGRVIRERGVTLRVAHGRTLRFAGLPAVLGRDPLAEVPLRDPGVSRQHAVLAADGATVRLTDTGSRLGTFVAGARLTASTTLGLQGQTEVTLGPSCRLDLRAAHPGAVILRGLGGLDTGLLGMVGLGRLPLAQLLPGVDGVWLEVDAAGAHLSHAPGLRIRLDGKLAAARIDLLHGDRVELPGDVLIEVP